MVTISRAAAGSTSRNRFTKVQWAHHLNLLKTLSALVLNLRIRSGHHFAHATTAQLWWHVQNCNLIEPLLLCKRCMYFCKIFGSRAHKTFVTWVPGLPGSDFFYLKAIRYTCTKLRECCKTSVSLHVCFLCHDVSSIMTTYQSSSLILQ